MNNVLEIERYESRFIEADEKEKIVLDNSQIQTFSFSYDGGRLTVSVNNHIVYETMDAGNDFSVSVSR